MKSKTLSLMFAGAWIVTTVTTVAQEQRSYHHYKLIDVGTFGAPSSWMTSPGVMRLGLLNNQGTLTGQADTSGVDPFC